MRALFWRIITLWAFCPSVHGFCPTPVWRRAIFTCWGAIQRATACFCAFPSFWGAMAASSLPVRGLLPKATLFPQRLEELGDAAFWLRFLDFAARVLLVVFRWTWRGMQGQVDTSGISTIVAPGMVLRVFGVMGVASVLLPTQILLSFMPSTSLPLLLGPGVCVVFWCVAVLQWEVKAGIGQQRSHFRNILWPGWGRVPVIGPVCKGEYFTFKLLRQK